MLGGAGSGALDVAQVATCESSGCKNTQDVVYCKVALATTLCALRTTDMTFEHTHVSTAAADVQMCWVLRACTLLVSCGAESKNGRVQKA